MLRISRRQLLRGLMLSGVATVLPVQTGLDRAAAADQDYPALLFAPVSLQPIIRVPNRVGDPDRQRMHMTLMCVRDQISQPIDDWYLWAWRHDTPNIQLYTSPTPEGPFTDRGSTPAPTPPAGYVASHMSSGDIVWDAAGGRFVSSPHSVRTSIEPGNREPCQDSFLIQSYDGQSWGFLDGNSSPRLVCGGPGTPDGVHTGYGRLLRDTTGDLARHDGKYWWVYRAQRNDEGVARKLYRPALASASDIGGSWAKSGPAWITPTANHGLIGFGSFVAAPSQATVFYTVASPTVFPSAGIFVTSSHGDMSFTHAGHPLPTPVSSTGGQVTISGGNLAQDPSTGSQYLIVEVLDPVATAVEVYLFKAVP